MSMHFLKTFFRCRHINYFINFYYVCQTFSFTIVVLLKIYLFPLKTVDNIL